MSRKTKVKVRGGILAKTERELDVTNPDSLDDIGDSDIVQLSRKLLDASVKSTDLLNMKEMTPNKLREAKMVLGFLNATNNVMKTKMSFFKMVGIDDKIKAVKKQSKRL